MFKLTWLYIISIRLNFATLIFGTFDKFLLIFILLLIYKLKYNKVRSYLIYLNVRIININFLLCIIKDIINLI